MNILRLACSAPWLIDATTASAYLPLLARLAEGDMPSFPQQPPLPPYSLYSPATNQWAPLTEDYNMPDEEEETTPEWRIQVYPVRGLITKADQECGPSGTETLMRDLMQNDADPEVMGHILDLDSGGGEGTNIQTVVATMREKITKPIVGLVNGYCCSAAYWMGAGCDELYATETTDVLGSIGVYYAWADMKPMWEKRGVKFHEVYAAQSDLKNAEWKLAEAGDYDAMRERMANPYAAEFIASIQSLRPELKDPRAYRGATFMAPEAIELGLIDGYMSMEAAANRVAELRQQAQAPQQVTSKAGALGASANSINSNNTTNMSFQRIKSALGISEPETEKMELSAQDAEKLAGLLSNTPQAADTTRALEALTAATTASAKVLSSLSEQLETMSAEVKALDERLKSFEAAPGAGKAAAAATTDAPILTDGVGITAELINNQIGAAMEAGQPIRFSK